MRRAPTSRLPTQPGLRGLCRDQPTQRSLAQRAPGARIVAWREGASWSRQGAWGTGERSPGRARAGGGRVEGASGRARAWGPTGWGSREARTRSVLSQSLPGALTARPAAATHPPIRHGRGGPAPRAVPGLEREAAEHEQQKCR